MGVVKMLTLDDMGEGGGVQKGQKLDDVINEQPLLTVHISTTNLWMYLHLQSGCFVLH